MTIIVIASGKGGVGKTSIAVNMAIMMSRLMPMQRVVLLDADLGLANANLLMGIQPAYTTRNIEDGMTAEEIITERYGIGLIAGESGARQKTLESVRRMLRACMDVAADVMVIDTSPGISDAMTEIISAGDHVIVVSTPEITALTDSYQLLKYLIRSGKVEGELHLLMNKTGERDDGSSKAAAVTNLCRDYLGHKVDHLGSIRHSQAVEQAIMEQCPFAIADPGSNAAHDIGDICQTIIEKRGENHGQ